MPLLLQAGNKFLRGIHVVSKFPRTARPLSNARSPTRPLASGAAAALHPLFRYWEIRPGIFRIEERFFDSWNRANMFYIRGTDRDMLVDTGMKYEEV